MDDNGWTPRYVRTLLFYVSMAAIIVGGLNTLFMGLLEINLIEAITGRGAVLIYLFIGIGTLYLMFDRDTYLPFLGPAHIPCGALEPRFPKGANREIIVHVAPQSKVLYWASEPAMEGLKNIPSWKGAYLGYENTGVALSDDKGLAILRIRTPQRYRVPIQGLLEPHVHYRVCEESGWMGRVMTVPVEGVPSVEPFSGQLHEYSAMWA